MLVGPSRHRVIVNFFLLFVDGNIDACSHILLVNLLDNLMFPHIDMYIVQSEKSSRSS